MTYYGTFENVIRVGLIESVDWSQQLCTIRLYDRVDDQRFTVSIPNPSSGLDTGVYHYPEPGTLVVVGWTYREQPVILSTLPFQTFSQDFTQENTTVDVVTGTTGYPELNQGEVALSGVGGTEIKLANFGCINMRFGNSTLDLDCGNRAVLATEEVVESTESHFSTSGIILRDLREVTTQSEKLENKSTDLAFLRNLSAISRDPVFAPVAVTSSLNDGLSEVQRNPPFVEDKKIIYEFAKSFMVDTLDEETDRLKEDDELDFLFQPNNRNNVRYNVLNLNPDNPNLLSEKVEGTLVDIYGNILDLNRHPIVFPGDTEGKKTTKERLQRLETLTRRSVKLHYEINSRKDAKGQISTTTLDGPDLPIGHNHSRWSIDVDGEGLTKLNIPASSNVGNIPLLTRYVTANMRAKDSTEDSGSQQSDSADTSKADPRDISFRPKSVDGIDTNRDIFHLAFGDLASDGVVVQDNAPGDIGESADEQIHYRTAYHDIINTASKALAGESTPGAPGQPPLSPDIEVDPEQDGSFQDAVDAAADSPAPSASGPSTPGSAPTALQTSALINKVAEQGAGGEPGPNAGGRSLFANLDGSLELNIGRDVIDNKSVVLDTSGGIISRIGKTLPGSNSASLISQLDGSVFIQVGGDSVGEEDKVEDPKVRLVVQGNKGTDEITIDENAVRIKTAVNGKNLILESSKNIILKANGTIMLAGSTVAIHGSVDDTGNDISPGRLVSQKGKEI